MNTLFTTNSDVRLTTMGITRTLENLGIIRQDNDSLFSDDVDIFFYDIRNYWGERWWAAEGLKLED
jgi:hypothetical protein